MSKLSIIIPARNEQECIKILLDELNDYKEIIGEIILVDGDSNDNTVAIAQKYNCKIVNQKNIIGYGAAIIMGINKSEYEYSVVLDADGSKDPKYIPTLYDKIENSKFDFIFAERYGKNAGSLDDTFITYFGNRLFTIFGKVFFKIKVNDILHTFFICRNKSFKRINFINKNFSFCPELPIKVEREKIPYDVIPTLERKKFAGEVKIRSLIDGFIILIAMIKLLA